MLGTSARLLRLLAVLQARRSWTGPALAARLEVTPRTLRRDVDRLRQLGYDVASVSGPGGGYTFGDGSDVPLLLGETEALAAAVALRTTEVFPKLEQLVPERLRARVGAVQTQSVTIGAAEPAVDARLLSTLAAACRDSEAVRMRYRSRQAEAAERTVYPLRLAQTTARRWYLVAWDPDRGDWRTFRVDRIERIVGVGPRVVRPDPPVDVERYVSESITSAPWPCRGQVELRGTAEAMAIPGWLGIPVPLGDDRWLLEVGAPSWDAVVGQLVMLGFPFVVVSPMALADHVQRVIERLGAAADR